jgi:hypothetical protein
MMQVQELERQMAGIRKDFELQENKWKERVEMYDKCTTYNIHFSFKTFTFVI